MAPRMKLRRLMTRFSSVISLLRMSPGFLTSITFLSLKLRDGVARGFPLPFYCRGAEDAMTRLLLAKGHQFQVLVFPGFIEFNGLGSRKTFLACVNIADGVKPADDRRMLQFATRVFAAQNI